MFVPPAPSALHAILAGLPPADATPVRAAELGAYWAAILSRRCGLASAPSSLPTARGGTQGDRTGLAPADMLGRPARELAPLVLSDHGLRAAWGMAAINSLIEPDESRCRELNARDLLLERGAGRTIAMVGHFPFVEELRAAARELWVLELQPRPGDLPAERAADVIPQAEVLALTGVTLLNHTFEGLIALRRPGAFAVMLGGTTPLAPALFDYGLDALGGTIVDEPVVLMSDIAAGATFRHLRGKRPVIMFR